MRSGWSIAATGLLLAALAGCDHRQAKVSPPPAAQAPTQPPAEMAEMIPKMPPVPPDADKKPVKLDTAVPPEQTSEATTPPPRRVKHHPKPAPAQEAAAQPDPRPAGPASPPAATPPQNPEVASGQPSEMSPIGQLSTANNNDNTADRQQVTDQINLTENKLNGIHRSLSADEQKTVALIRTFITKARDAVKTDDLDGARAYNTKAKLLLEELSKP